VAQAIAQAFHVQPDEVAVLELSQRGKALKFVPPDKLRLVGSILLTSSMALAARTARERRLEIDNNFAAARHASVFEGMPLGRLRDESIHKIMSAPILQGNKVIGVVQISHKGPSPNQMWSRFYDNRSHAIEQSQRAARPFPHHLQDARLLGSGSRTRFGVPGPSAKTRLTHLCF
jgi:hypothetical protein